MKFNTLEQNFAQLMRAWHYKMMVLSFQQNKILNNNNNYYTQTILQTKAKLKQVLKHHYLVASL